ncbi:unnamed protein product, partial [Symbiodinium necroappetens]
FERLRKSFVEFTVAHPSRKFRHEKVDVKLLLERRDETYVDVAQVFVWRSLKAFCDAEYATMSFKNDMQRRAFLLRSGIKLQKDDRGVEGVAVPKDDNGSESKEIKIGKRLSAAKVRQQDMSEGYSKEAIKEQQRKNAQNLVVSSSTQAPSSGRCRVIPSRSTIMCLARLEYFNLIASCARRLRSTRPKARWRRMKRPTAKRRMMLQAAHLRNLGWRLLLQSAVSCQRVAAPSRQRQQQRVRLSGQQRVWPPRVERSLQALRKALLWLLALLQC